MRRDAAALLLLAMLASACGTDSVGDDAAPADESPPAASADSTPEPGDDPSPSEEPAPSEEPTTEPSEERAVGDDVQVTLTCERGDGLDTLPFDPAWADGFDQDVPPETRWVRGVLTITNDGDSWVQVEPEFTTVYLDEAGDQIATGLYRATAAALAAGPGEVVQDTLTEYEQVRGLLAVAQEDEQAVFDRLDSCGVEDVAVSETEPIAVDPDLVEAGPPSQCTYTTDGALLIAEWPVANVTSEELPINALLAVRDSEGRRLHTIPGVRTRLPAGEEFTMSATAFRQNLADPDAEVTCELLATPTFE